MSGLRIVVGADDARRLVKWLDHQFNPASALAAKVSAITEYEPAAGC